MSSLIVTIQGQDYQVELDLIEQLDMRLRDGKGRHRPPEHRSWLRLPVKINGETVIVQMYGAPAVKGGQSSPVGIDRPNTVISPAETEWLVIDNRSYELTIDRDLRWIRSYQGIFSVEVRSGATQFRPISGDGRIKAPIPGLITKVMVQPGDEVVIGQPLVNLEAMKMENEIRSSRQGVVREVNVRPGQTVALHEVLVEIG